MYDYIQNHKVYVWHKHALRQATIEEQTIYRDEMPSVKLFGEWHDADKVYESEKDYIDGLSYNKKNSYCSLPAGRLRMKEERGTEQFYYFVLINGRPERYNFCDNVVAVPNPKKGEYGWDFTPSDVPAEYYPTEEACRGMMELSVVDENGAEKVYEGACRRVMLSEEQKKLVANLKAAYEAAVAAGVRFAYDSYNCEVRLWSDPDNQAVVEYGGDVDTDAYEFADINNVTGFSVKAESFYEMTEEVGLWVKKSN